MGTKGETRPAQRQGETGRAGARREGEHAGIGRGGRTQIEPEGVVRQRPDIRLAGGSILGVVEDVREVLLVRDAPAGRVAGVLQVAQEEGALVVVEERRTEALHIVLVAELRAHLLSRARSRKEKRRCGDGGESPAEHASAGALGRPRGHYAHPNYPLAAFRLAPSFRVRRGD